MQISKKQLKKYAKEDGSPTRKDGLPYYPHSRAEKRHFRQSLSYQFFQLGSSDGYYREPINHRLPDHAKARIASYMRGYEAGKEDRG